VNSAVFILFFVFVYVLWVTQYREVGISVCKHGCKQQGGFVFIDISGMLESDEFLEKLADFVDSKLPHR